MDVRSRARARELELEKEAAIDAYVEARIGEHEEYVDDLVEARREVAALQKEKEGYIKRFDQLVEIHESMKKGYVRYESVLKKHKELYHEITSHIMGREALRRGCEHAGGERGVELWPRGVL